MTQEPIATPVGLFKAGPSGAGGMYQTLGVGIDAIRRDIFENVTGGNGLIYGLLINRSVLAPTKKSMIIDISYDGQIETDPHSAHPLVFSGSYPAQDRGLWYGCFRPPNNRPEFSMPKIHRVGISVAPRVAPLPGKASAEQVLPPRDFSAEVGGREAFFEFEIFPSSEKIRGIYDPDSGSYL